MTDLSTPIDLRGERSVGSLLTEPAITLGQLGGWLIAVMTWIVVVALAQPIGSQLRTGQEAFCYWVASLHAPYALSDWTQPIAYVYSPAFLQAIEVVVEHCTVAPPEPQVRRSAGVGW